MMNRARCLGLGLIVSCLTLAPVSLVARQQAAAPAAAATSLQADLLKDWESLRDTMVKIADAMPPEKYDYRPKPEVRTYGEQVLHVASATVLILKSIDPKITAPTLPATALAKADAIKALTQSFEFGSTLLKSQTNATLLETVSGPSFLGPSTRARLVYRTMGHTWDEYGVMTVYLRLNGLVPPASQK
jgi:uncharacterized damage-inducible protein DinB